MVFILTVFIRLAISDYDNGIFYAAYRLVTPLTLIGVVINHTLLPSIAEQDGKLPSLSANMWGEPALMKAVRRRKQWSPAPASLILPGGQGTMASIQGR